MVYTLSFLIISLLIPKLRATLIWLTGKQDYISGLLGVVICIMSIIALLIWAHWSNCLGVGTGIFTSLFKIPILAAINAIIEEFIFRGVLQESLLNILKEKYVLVILQAIPCADYTVGFPNGAAIGFVMVFVWGSVCDG